MIAETYDEALHYVFLDEGDYSNDPGDPGGPTRWGITIEDARHYWKPNATASDVRRLPVPVAQDIYAKHYATPLHYNELPAGVDYTVLDFGINSGIDRAAHFLQRRVGVAQDGRIGPATIAAAQAANPLVLIQRLNDDRLRFLQGLRTWHLFGHGWGPRVHRVNIHSLAMAQKYGAK